MYEYVSAIANCLTAIITCTAFIVGWLTYRKEYAVKLKIDVSDTPGLIASPKNNLGDYGFSICIVNRSGRPVTIQNVWLTTKHSEYSLTGFTTQTKRLEIADVYQTVIIIPTKEMIRQMWLGDNHAIRNKSLKQRMIIRLDATCGTYTYKTKTTVAMLLELRQNHPEAIKLCETPEDIELLTKC